MNKQITLVRHTDDKDFKNAVEILLNHAWKLVSAGYSDGTWWAILK